MGEPDSSDVPPRDVLTSTSYRQDLANAVAYAVIGAIFLGVTAIHFAFLDTGRGRTAAVEFFSSFGPVSSDLALQFAFFAGYVLLFFSGLSFLLVAYSGVVRPLQRATGMLDHASADSADDSRASVSIETVDGRQTLRPDAECADCEETAIGVLATEFVDSAAGEVVPVCPMHLHERRDELESRSQRVEVETFV